MRINTTTTILSTSLLALAAMGLSGCFLFEPDGDLEAVYISGHLGNYWDCPDQAYTPGQRADGAVGSDAGGAPSEPQGDFAPGACEPAPAPDGGANAPAEGDVAPGYCGGPLNCEGAQATFQLSNPTGLARGIRVSEILLLNDSGAIVASLPVLNTELASGAEAFDGELSPGESVSLRVYFRGPANPYELLEDASGASDEGRLQIVIDSDTDGPVELITDAVYSQPGVVT